MSLFKYTSTSFQTVNQTPTNHKICSSVYILSSMRLLLILVALFVCLLYSTILFNDFQNIFSTTLDPHINWDYNPFLQLTHTQIDEPSWKLA